MFGRFARCLGDLAGVWEIWLVFERFVWDFEDLAGNSGKCLKFLENV